MIPEPDNAATAIDPVCGMVVIPRKQSIVSTYKNCIYHFCAEGCRTTFDANPEKYLADKAGKPKSIWKRYLARLNKATGGKPPQCCQ